MLACDALSAAPHVLLSRSSARECEDEGGDAGVVRNRPCSRVGAVFALVAIEVCRGISSSESVPVPKSWRAGDDSKVRRRSLQCIARHVSAGTCGGQAAEENGRSGGSAAESGMREPCVMAEDALVAGAAAKDGSASGSSKTSPSSSRGLLALEASPLRPR